jgi:hypothetical protein
MNQNDHPYEAKLGKLTFKAPPKANWQISFGKIPTPYSTYICIYIEDPPNRFQRWMIKKVLGIHWTRVE